MKSASIGRALLVTCVVAGASLGRGAESAAPARPPEILLYCGAGIRPAAEALIQAFETNRHVKVVVQYGGSGQLLGQLTASKQGDLFMPGEAFYVEKAVASGLAEPATRRDVACFVPVILVQKGNPLGVTGLRDFAEKNLRIGLGDERVVAVGRKSLDLFRTNGIPLDAVMSRVVLKSGTVSELGVAIDKRTIDAAIVWDATARQFSRSGDAVAIPPSQNLVTPIPVIRLKFCRQPAEAEAFIQFVASAEGRRILLAKGYTLP